MSEIVIQAKEIILVDPKKLMLHVDNVNIHTDEQINELVEQYRYQGMRDPVTVSNLSGYVVEGNGRVMAALKAELQAIPVIYQNFENEDQELAYMIAHNAVAKDAWATIDMAKINSMIERFDPNFNIDRFALKDFVIDPAEMPTPFNEPNDKIDPKLKEPQLKLCPNCGVVIENG